MHRREKFWLLIGIITGILILGISIHQWINQAPYLNKFITTLINDGEDEFTKEDISQYEFEISKEIKDSNSRSNLKKAYYALAKLKQYQGEHLESNQLLHKLMTVDRVLNEEMAFYVQMELAINHVSLEDYRIAYQAFKEAELLATGLENDEMKAQLYFQYGKSLLLHTDNIGNVISLFEAASDLGLGIRDEIELNNFLADCYLSAGLYDQAISYLIRGQELAMDYHFPDLQQELLMKLGSAYYFNNNYELVIQILDPLGINQEKEQDFIAFTQLIRACQKVYGNEEMDAFYQQQKAKLAELDTGTNLKEKLFILDLQRMLFTGQNQQVKELINEMKLDGMNQNDMIALWMDKLEVDLDSQKSPNDIKLIDNYKELYNRAKNLNFSMGKLLLMNDIVEQTLDMGDFSVAYQYLKDQDLSLNNGHRDFNGDNVEESYVQVTDRVGGYQLQLRITKLMENVLFFTLGVVATGGAYRLYNKSRKLKNGALSKHGIDPLTQTLTKEDLYECLEYHVSSGHYLTFILVNIDNFRRYNELYGYLQGNQVIKQLASLIKESLPNSYISRHHGENFIIVIEGKDYDYVQELQLLFERMAELNIPDVKNLELGRVTISAGASGGITTSRLDIDKYINAATHKLEQSKQRGKNKFTL